MSDDIRKFINIFEQVKLRHPNSKFPDWLFSDLFVNKAYAACISLKLRPVELGSTFYMELFKIFTDRQKYNHEITQKIDDPKYHTVVHQRPSNRLQFYRPSISSKSSDKLNELEMPTGDISQANELLKKFRLDTKPENKEMEEIDPKKYYFAIDILNVSYYTFPLKRNENEQLQTAGSPGFSGQYFFDGYSFNDSIERIQSSIRNNQSKGML